MRAEYYDAALMLESTEACPGYDEIITEHPTSPTAHSIIQLRHNNIIQTQRDNKTNNHRKLQTILICIICIICRYNKNFSDSDFYDSTGFRLWLVWALMTA